MLSFFSGFNIGQHTCPIGFLRNPIGYQRYPIPLRGIGGVTPPQFTNFVSGSASYAGQLRDWVFKKCENVTTPEEKLASLKPSVLNWVASLPNLKIWKKLNSKPCSPYWSPVAFETFGSERAAFEVDGQWYSVDVTRARNLIKEEMGG